MIKFLKFIPFQLTFFLVIGILVGNYFNFQPMLLVELGMFLLLIFGLVYIFTNKQFQPTFLFSSVFFLLSFFVGVNAITFKNNINKQKHYTSASLFLEQKPFLVSMRIEKVLKPNLYNAKYEAEVFQIENTDVIGKILLNIQLDTIKRVLEVDDVLVVKTEFKTINEPLNPYSFNYNSYLKHQQIHHQISLKSNQFLKLPKNQLSLKGFASKIRGNINSALVNNGFKNDELAVINALILGQRNSITTDLLESYVGAGAIHILAVSGLHVGIILLLLTFLCKPLHYFKNGKLIATVFIVLLLWMYAIIAGLSASVVRAVSMFTALTVGMQLVQRSSIYNTLVISLFFLLMFNPFYLFEVGFQLSYLAVFSIVWIQPKLYHLWKPAYWLPDKLWQLFTVSIAAQLGVLPLSLFYFHQFPGLFFLSNLILIPFLGFIIVSGILTLVLAVFDVLPGNFRDAYIFIIETMNGFVDWVANQEAFLIQDISFSLQLMLVIYLFIFLFFKWIEKKIFYRFILVLLAFICIQVVLVFEKFTAQTNNEFVVFNKSKSSLIGIRVGRSLLLNSPDSLKLNDYALKSYVIGSGVSKNFQIINRNLFKFKNEVILVVDSLGLYNFKSIKPSIVILQNSPKINLERLLKKIKPTLIVADGSNYVSLVMQWEKTCVKNKTPFHSTMQKGAFILK
ncbi:MAG: ComEC/Rec2 family competence protein [Lutibacter sp.]|uniref:ComEC/Rec2 family competence protein n=1 Tax=Lutibacter sp. TaxID=1925666 RepID=UPI0017D0C7A9|nr:competence protein ComEC family protein [Lutibacter sp.]NNJ57806.1 ComEC/Rec2 family competence protein [Lutibacter sp.]